MNERDIGAWKEGATAAVLRPYPKTHRGGVPDICDSWNEFLNQSGFQSVGVMPRDAREEKPWRDADSMSLGFAVRPNHEPFKTAFWLTVLNPSPSRIKKLIPYITSNNHHKNNGRNGKGIHGNNHNQFTTDARFASWDPRDQGELGKIWDLAHYDYLDGQDPEMYHPAYYIGLTGKAIEPLSNPGRVLTLTLHAETTIEHLHDFWLAYWLQDKVHIADAVIVNTPHMAEIYSNIADNIVIVGNPVDKEKYTPDGPKLEGFGKENFLDGQTNIVYVGRLEERKGLITALKAIAILISNTDMAKDFRLIIAGSGPQEEELHQMVDELGINNHIVFIPNISEEDKVKLYRTADFCYFPAESEESFGNVLLEAWSSRKSTLTGKAYSRFLVKHGQNGFSLETDDPLEAAYYLALMINNPSWVRNMGVTALELVQPFAKERIFGEKLDLVTGIHIDKLRRHEKNPTFHIPNPIDIIAAPFTIDVI